MRTKKSAAIRRIFLSFFVTMNSKLLCIDELPSLGDMTMFVLRL
ncbi:MAG: hypothetical protein WAM39_01275 [Bryobacteraceae bacterium]